MIMVIMEMENIIFINLINKINTKYVNFINKKQILNFEYRNYFKRDIIYNNYIF